MGTSDDDLETTRPLIQFSASPWGDFFLSVPIDHSVSTPNPFTCLVAHNMILDWLIFVPL